MVRAVGACRASAGLSKIRAARAFAIPGLRSAVAGRAVGETAVGVRDRMGGHWLGARGIGRQSEGGKGQGHDHQGAEEESSNFFHDITLFYILLARALVGKQDTIKNVI